MCEFHEVTEEEALRIAKEYGLEEEIRYEMEENNLTPAQALREWDL